MSAFLHCFKKKNQGFFPHVLPSVHWCLCSISHTLKLSKHFIPKTVFVGVRMTNYSLKSCNFSSPTSVLVKWKVRFLQLCLPTQILSSLMSVNSVDTCPPFSVLFPTYTVFVCWRVKVDFSSSHFRLHAKWLNFWKSQFSFTQWNTGTLAGQLLLFCFFKEAIFLVVRLF